MPRVFDELIQNDGLSDRDLAFLEHELDAAINELAYDIFITKAKKDPTTLEGILAFEALLVNKLVKVLSAAKNRAMKKLKARFSKDRLAKVSPLEVNNLISEVQGIVSDLGNTSGRLVVPVINSVQQQVFKATNKVMAQDFSTKTRFNAKDKKALDFMSRQQNFFVKGHFNDRVSVGLQNKIRRGFDSGMSMAQLAEHLYNSAENTILKGSKNYLQLVSSATVNTARSYSNLVSFQDAGVVQFEIVAVIDEVTSFVCKHIMNGRTFTVEVALKRFENLMSANTPEEYKRLMPWCEERNTDKGRIYRVNNFDFDETITDEALEQANFSTPPFHGNCRTTMIATVISKNIKFFIMGG